MNQKLNFGILFLIICAGILHASARPFTYQGRLVDEGNFSSGAFDFEFRLFDAASGGKQIGESFVAVGAAVDTGLFTVDLQFPDAAFSGEERWFQIAVRTNGSAVFTDLVPRQKIGATPQAVFAANAAMTLPNSVDTTSLIAGAVTSSRISEGSLLRSINGQTDHVQLISGANIIFNLNSNHMKMASSSSPRWSPYGNVLSSNQFLGSLNDVPVHLNINAQRMLRLEDRPESPNITAGRNRISPGFYGPVIPHGSTIGGGSGNSVGGLYSVVNGGVGNYIYGSEPFGGHIGLVFGSTIGGGRYNLISGTGPYDALGQSEATIAGGRRNYIGGYSQAGTIGGGATNGLDACTFFATIGGGRGNGIYGGCDGWRHYDGAIVGGALNLLSSHSWGSAIRGGLRNVCGGDLDYPEIRSTIGGGSDNRINFMTPRGLISGGRGNTVQGSESAVAGGRDNRAVTSYDPGFLFNHQRVGSVVAGGRANAATGEAPTIAGGSSNIANGAYSAIPGGIQAKTYNYGQLAFASGKFRTEGDAQLSMYVLRTISSNSLPSELTLDGKSKIMQVQTNASWAFDALVVGRSPTRTVSFQIYGAVENTGGSCTLVGAPAKEIFGDNPEGMDATIAADSSRRALTLHVIGSTNAPMRWVANVRVAEVTF